MSTAISSLPIGQRRELFVDDFLIDEMDNCRLVPHKPQDEGRMVTYDRPWEGVYCGSETVIKAGGEYRLYYRGMPFVKDGDQTECTCLATSPDGVEWTRPELGLFEINGSSRNNAVLAHQPPFSHNFMPFLDARPGVEDAERFKAVAGLARSGGLFAFVSSDGIHWERRGDAAIITHEEGHAFDSPNLAFWSETEKCYVCYYRTWHKGPGDRNLRWVSRKVSDDFVNWSTAEEMEYRHNGVPAPEEEFYTTGTHPYFRAPHIYVAMPRRFMFKRAGGGLEQADWEDLQVVPNQRGSCSDTVLLTSRGGSIYDRTFLEAFMRPGPERANWSARAGTVAAGGMVQTGEREMSLYRNDHYGSPSVHLRRFSMRLDGFSSVNAGYHGGRIATHPLQLEGDRLELNYETSAAGQVRVELQDADGTPLPGYTMNECTTLIGDEIAHTVTWNERDTLGNAVNRPVRLVLELKDADVYAFRTVPA